jgi:hypothetical protein
VLGGFIGRAVAAAARSVAAAAVSAAANELRKPETQQKIARSVVAVSATLRDPEKRAGVERAAGTAGRSAARALGRAAGTLRNKLGGG